LRSEYDSYFLFIIHREFCEGGSLSGDYDDVTVTQKLIQNSDYLQSHGQIEQGLKNKFIYHIALGMFHLHQEGVIHRSLFSFSNHLLIEHRDLAARNILLSKHLEAKVTDIIRHRNKIFFRYQILECHVRQKLKNLEQHRQQLVHSNGWLLKVFS